MSETWFKTPSEEEVPLLRTPRHPLRPALHHGHQQLSGKGKSSFTSSVTASGLGSSGLATLSFNQSPCNVLPPRATNFVVQSNGHEASPYLSGTGDQHYLYSHPFGSTFGSPNCMLPSNHVDTHTVYQPPPNTPDHKSSSWTASHSVSDHSSDTTDCSEIILTPQSDRTVGQRVTFRPLPDYRPKREVWTQVQVYESIESPDPYGAEGIDISMNPSHFHLPSGVSE